MWIKTKQNEREKKKKDNMYTTKWNREKEERKYIYDRIKEKEKKKKNVYSKMKERRRKRKENARTTISQTEHDSPKPGKDPRFMLALTVSRTNRNTRLDSNTLVLTELHLLSCPVGSLRRPSAGLLNAIWREFRREGKRCGVFSEAGGQGWREGGIGKYMRRAVALMRLR